MFGIQDILNGMKFYCELFQGKCENCFFNITKQINSDLEAYDICKCAMKLIENRVKLNESGAVKNEKRKD
jgi:hypothetical protein